MFSRLENLRPDKGIVWGSFQPSENQTRTDPNDLKDTRITWSVPPRVQCGVSHVMARRHYSRLSGRMAGSSTIREPMMWTLKVCARYGHEKGGSRPLNPDSYKIVGVVEDILLTLQRLVPPSRLLLSFSTSLVAGSTHTPRAHTLSFKEQRNLRHDEQPAKYPLEVFDRYSLGHRNIRSVMESDRKGGVLTRLAIF